MLGGNTGNEGAGIGRTAKEQVRGCRIAGHGTHAGLEPLFCWEVKIFQLFMFLNNNVKVPQMS